MHSPYSTPESEKQRANKDLLAAINYLKTNNLLAVPFDKGCGFYVMKRSSYEAKLDKVLSVSQFQLQPSSKRKMQRIQLSKKRRESTVVCRDW